MTSGIDRARAGIGKRWQRARKKHRPQLSRYYTLPLTTEPVSPSLACGFRLVAANEENLAQLKAEFPKELNDRKHGILRQRVQDPAEDAWLILDEDDSLCGFTCLAWQDHEVRMMGHVIRVRPDQALFMDDYVFTRHRRRGAHTAAVALRVPLAADRGRTEGLVLVATRNTSSSSSYRKVGFRPAGTLVHLPGVKRTVELWTPRPLRRR